MIRERVKTEGVPAPEGSMALLVWIIHQNGFQEAPMWNLDAVFSQDPCLHLREVGVGGMLQKARLFYTLVLNQIIGDRVLGVVEKENLDSILKSRDITLLTKVCLVKAMVFPVVVCRCESWIIKKTECQRINAFEVWCWWRFLRVPWTARSSTSASWMKSVLNIHWKDWCWSWSSNTLATWCEKMTR